MEEQRTKAKPHAGGKEAKEDSRCGSMKLIIPQKIGKPSRSARKKNFGAAKIGAAE